MLDGVHYQRDSVHEMMDKADISSMDPSYRHTYCHKRLTELNPPSDRQIEILKLLYVEFELNQKEQELKILQDDVYRKISFHKKMARKYNNCYYYFKNKYAQEQTKIYIRDTIDLLYIDYNKIHDESVTVLTLKNHIRSQVYLLSLEIYNHLFS